MLMRFASISCILLALLLTGGCVEQTLEFKTDPPGAAIFLDGQEIGGTPLKHDFKWYATYDVDVRKDGYQTLKTRAKVKAPLYQWIPLDLVCDLLPFEIKDVHHFNYTLVPEQEDVDANALAQRGEQLRGQLQSGHFPPATRKSASTQPAK
jgi:hypothetical protein